MTETTAQRQQRLRKLANSQRRPAQPSVSRIERGRRRLSLEERLEQQIQSELVDVEFQEVPKASLAELSRVMRALPERGKKRTPGPKERLIRERLGKSLGARPQMHAPSEVDKVDWVLSGEVVPAKTLADAWGLTPQALGPAIKRGEIFAIVTRNQRYFPSEFLALDRGSVAQVCKKLEPLGPEEKLFFWKRKHGALGGRTALEVLTATEGGPGLPGVLRLASASSAQARAAAERALKNANETAAETEATADDR